MFLEFELIIMIQKRIFICGGVSKRLDYPKFKVSCEEIVFLIYFNLKTFVPET